MYAKYYENPTMLFRVIAKNVGDVFFETHCSCFLNVFDIYGCGCYVKSGVEGADKTELSSSSADCSSWSS